VADFSWVSQSQRRQQRSAAPTQFCRSVVIATYFGNFKCHSLSSHDKCFFFWCTAVFTLYRKRSDLTCKRMHRLAFIMYLCSACRCVVLVLQKLCTTAKYFFVHASRLALGWLSVRVTVTLGLRLGIGIGLGIRIGLGIGLGLGIGIADLNQIADLKLSILAPIQIAVHFYKQYNFRHCLGFCRDRKLEYTQLTFQSSIRLNPVFSTFYLSLSLAEKHRECYFPSTWTDI